MLSNRLSVIRLRCSKSDRAMKLTCDHRLVNLIRGTAKPALYKWQTVGKLPISEV